MAYIESIIYEMDDSPYHEYQNYEGTLNINQSSLPYSLPKPEEKFLLSFCHLVDFPLNGIACSQVNPQKCVQCPIQGKFFTGESIHNYQSWALFYYYILWVITVLISIVGVFSNILIVKVVLRINKKEMQRSFDFLLVVLACFDTICSILTITAATGFMSYFGNWTGRGMGSMYWCFISLYSFAFGRSISTYITILITIERFLMITFPLKMGTWLTHRKTICMTVGMLLWSVLINYPRFVSWCVEKNDWRDVESLQEIEYVVRPTTQGKLFYQTLKAMHNNIDFWLPLPTLLFFNLLSYIKVHQLSKRRKEMNMKQKRDIRAVKMFLPIVIAYFLINIEPMVNIFIIVVYRTTYRELYMLMFLAVAANSVVNLPIYYFRNMSFKTGAKLEIAEWMAKLGLESAKDRGRGEQKDKYEEIGMSNTGGASDSGFGGGGWVGGEIETRDVNVSSKFSENEC